MWRAEKVQYRLNEFVFCLLQTPILPTSNGCQPPPRPISIIVDLHSPISMELEAKFSVLGTIPSRKRAFRECYRRFRCLKRHYPRKFGGFFPWTEVVVPRGFMSSHSMAIMNGGINARLFSVKASIMIPVLFRMNTLTIGQHRSGKHNDPRFIPARPICDQHQKSDPAQAFGHVIMAFSLHEKSCCVVSVATCFCHNATPQGLPLSGIELNHSNLLTSKGFSR